MADCRIPGTGDQITTLGIVRGDRGGEYTMVIGVQKADAIGTNQAAVNRVDRVHDLPFPAFSLFSSLAKTRR